MNIIEINSQGNEFIAYRTKQIKQTLWIFPLFLVVSTGIGIFKLGLSGLSLLFILFTFPVFLIGLYNAAIKPKKIIANIITKIEIHHDRYMFHTSTNSFESTIVKRKHNLTVFNLCFSEYYTVFFNSEEYLLFPEFFDNFKSIREELNLEFNGQ
jgi:hypothetical protein